MTTWVVYFILAAEVKLFKVGKTNEPKARMYDLQTGNPYDLSVYRLLLCNSEQHALETEKAIQKSLARYSRRGEWFGLEPWIVDEYTFFLSHDCGFKMMTLDEFEKAKPKPVRHCVGWTEDEAKEMKSMHQEGTSHNEMAAKLGRSKHAIHQQLHRMKKNTQTNGNGKRGWSKDETEVLLRMRFKEGKTMEQLAKHFGRSEAAVRQYLWNLKQRNKKEAQKESSDEEEKSDECPPEASTH